MMERLIRSLIDFKTEVAPQLRPLFKSLAQGQNPELLLFTCCDSRVMPHLLTGNDPGGVFTVRTIGNIVAPSSESGLSVGDVSEASAIEYACDILGIRDIAVCGHSNCGAMKAVLEGRQKLTSTPNLREWLQHGDPALARLEKSPFISEALAKGDQLSQANVLVQLEHIASFPSVKQRKDVRLHGLWFDIEHMMVSLFEPDQKRFVALDEREIERLMKIPPEE